MCLLRVTIYLVDTLHPLGHHISSQSPHAIVGPFPIP